MSTLKVNESPKLIIFSDFDGTITLQDTGIILIDEYLTTVVRKELDDKIFTKTMAQRDVFKKMWNSVTCDWEMCKLKLKDVELDPYFSKFYQYTQAKSIPFTILSSGFTQIIDWFLENNLKEFNSKVAANEGIYTEKGFWDVKFYDDSEYGHDKALTIKKIKENYPSSKVLFIGDGVSDIMACSQSDFIFAKKSKDLAKYCTLNNIQFTEFEDFGEIESWLDNYLN
ncbi:hypothetical protein CONCODRAFT_11406 [Conidiobolus coronatus NRRL 28638]|uniref:HAD-like protein n=1 Tax=Conidiobolus coronatus (strain ATCC 28846 / CBS 209.66 / NRRL 28638) TaxID=796925 RepID=A0A137NV96_CONC2|nr:hypothetical protein CONCODRAFT_11406 [Conidiobolus coronatus NRRL 28638]|eukprot:KXN66696.1 hypothetical protein CONCODRAFT_11406 [Conidiobolus coronatus NRRL 28638]